MRPFFPLALLTLSIFLSACSVAVAPHPTSASNPQTTEQSHAAAQMHASAPGISSVGRGAPHLRVQINDRASGSLMRFALPSNAQSRASLVNGAQIHVEVQADKGVSEISLGTGFDSIALRQSVSGRWIADFQYENQVNDPDAQAMLILKTISQGKPFQAIIPVTVVHDP